MPRNTRIDSRLILMALGTTIPCPSARHWCGALQQSKVAESIKFRDVAQSAGLSFVYRNSPTPDKYFVESAPGGLAVFDYNNDGRPDIFFTNGAPTPALVKNSAAYSNRLYRNDGGLRFTDVDDRRRPRRRRVRDGRGRRGLRQRWTRRFVRCRRSSEPAASESRRRPLRGRHVALRDREW
jgi:hypothetical protein